MTDLFLNPGAASPTDVITSDPTAPRANGNATAFVIGVITLLVVGLLTIHAGASSAAAGQARASVIGSESVTAGAGLQLTGLSKPATTGMIASTGGGRVNQAGISSPTALHGASAAGSALRAATGLVSPSDTGDLAPMAAASVAPSGIAGFAPLGDEFAFGTDESSWDGDASVFGVSTLSTTGAAVASGTAPVIEVTPTWSGSWGAPYRPFRPLIVDEAPEVLQQHATARARGHRGRGHVGSVVARASSKSIVRGWRSGIVQGRTLTSAVVTLLKAAPPAAPAPPCSAVVAVVQDDDELLIVPTATSPAITRRTIGRSRHVDSEHDELVVLGADEP